MAFLGEDFLLDTPQARELFHGFASGRPIIDYHCHLDPAQIAEDTRFDNLTQVWLKGDHYKWRAMRWSGVDERFCTGNASDRAKFEAWAATVPGLLRNPLYHWTHLELKRPFGIEELLSPESADRIWENTRERLREPGFTARGLIQQAGVEVLCTTDDPADDLCHHSSIAASDFGTRVLPTWRPDRSRAIQDPSSFLTWLRRLETCSNLAIGDFATLLEALDRRHAAFHAAGCRLSDHGLEGFPGAPCTEQEAVGIFQRLLQGQAPSESEVEGWSSLMLLLFAERDQAKGWAQQYHIGPIRNPNARALRELGPDTGFDAIDDRPFARNLAAHLSRLEERGHLPRTVLYNLNPRDNEVMAVLAGSFQDGSYSGRIQFGAAWWFLDQLDGMQRQMEALSQLGVLGHWVGMLTDSRSLLSYSRHEYFRRLLCRILGRDMRDGLIPDECALVGPMVERICHHNARSYFFGQ